MKKTLTLTILTFILLAGCAGDSTPDTTQQSAVDNSEICKSIETGDQMTLEEAKLVSRRTKLCRDKLKENAVCNETTGTWWIDIESDKEGCNPACVINIATKNVEVNWRCTGLIPE